MEPENRPAACGLETEWEKRLRDLTAAEAELIVGSNSVLARSARKREPGSVVSVPISAKFCTAPTTTDRDRKELLRTLLEEVIVAVDRPEHKAHLTLRWRGGELTEIDLPPPRSLPRGLRTSEDTLSLLPRLAALYPTKSSPAS